MADNETKSYPSMSTTEIDKAIEKISGALRKVETSYLSIVGLVAKLKDTKAYETKGYKNIYDMTADLFGMSRGTTHNMIAINARFCENYKLTDEAKDRSMRELLRTIADEKAEALLEKQDDVESEEAETDDIEQNELNGKSSTLNVTLGSGREEYEGTGYDYYSLEIEDEADIVETLDLLAGNIMEDYGRFSGVKVTVMVQPIKA